ncbi:MAG: 50S ribosomal protein L21 [Patescibacteria group bacterium]
MIAIIETGGKQYIVSPGQKIQIEKIPGKAGDKFDFDKVLLISENSNTQTGKPYLEGKKISAEITEQKRLPKVTVFKYHSKTRYKKTKGHRQNVTVVKVV